MYRCPSGKSLMYFVDIFSWVRQLATVLVSTIHPAEELQTQGTDTNAERSVSTLRVEPSPEEILYSRPAQVDNELTARKYLPAVSGTTVPRLSCP